MAGERPITVYANPLSPYVNKVRAFLNLKGLNYRLHYVDPTRQKQELEFSGQTAVPVVTVGHEVLVDSTPICLRLEEIFPTHPPGLPADAALRDKLLALDRWVSASLIPTGFYTSQNLPLAAKLRNGWLSGTIHSVTAPQGLPLWMKLMGPVFVVRARFVSGIIDHIDPATPVSEVRRNACEDFIARLEGGPFLGGQSSPSLPDCAAYGHFIPCWMGGMVGYEEFAGYRELAGWVQRMTPLAYTPKPFWPKQLVRRDPERF